MHALTFAMAAATTLLASPSLRAETAQNLTIDSPEHAQNTHESANFARNFARRVKRTTFAATQIGPAGPAGQSLAAQPSYAVAQDSPQRPMQLHSLHPIVCSAPGNFAQQVQRTALTATLVGLAGPAGQSLTTRPNSDASHDSFQEPMQHHPLNPIVFTAPGNFARQVQRAPLTTIRNACAGPWGLRPPTHGIC